MQWEYLLLRVSYATMHIDTGVHLEGGVATVGVTSLPAALNQLGDEEWEAVGMGTEAQGAIKQILLKRPKDGHGS
jgi:hypothetical protein